jgi:hypothetical protein
MPSELREVANQRAGAKGGIARLFHIARCRPALPQRALAFGADVAEKPCNFVGEAQTRGQASRGRYESA